MTTDPNPPRYNEVTVAERVNKDAAASAVLATLGESDNRAKFRAVLSVLGEVASGVNPKLTVKHVHDHPYPNVRVYQDERPLVNVSIYMIGASANFTSATHASAYQGDGISEWDAPVQWVAAFSGFPSQKSWKPELQVIA